MMSLWEPVVNDIDEAEDWLDAWTADVSARASRAADLSRRMSTLSAKAHSRDGSITVMVGSNGQMEDLQLDDRVHDMSARQLSQEILTVMRMAQHRLTEQVGAHVRDTVGLDSETGRAVFDAFTHRFPPAERSDER